MAYLDTYQTLLTSGTAGHLLRRATFGPTKKEIESFTGLTATQAVDQLISNVSRRLTPANPVDYEETSPTFKQSFLALPFNKAKTEVFNRYIRYWWIGLMAEQSGYPSILEKLASFWQNHFVVASTFVMDYRMMFRYLRLIREKSLGSFKVLAIEMTKDPAMLIYQNGNENQKGKPNENYARELQELFVVGVRDFYGNENYTEEDVRSAAKVLTGWQAVNHLGEGSTTIDSVFNPDRHDDTNKEFSSYYGNHTIQGRAGFTAGALELEELINLLVQHPESPKFICRKLYRWFVNNEVTQEIETNVIIPLANLFASAENNFKVEPVLRKLLTSQIFFDQTNIGATIKSPVEWTIGLLRIFDQPVPDSQTDITAFKNYAKFVNDQLNSLQYGLLDQPNVFGYPPFYLTGYSDNWINSGSLGSRNLISNRIVYPYVVIKPGYVLGIDYLKWLTAVQPNFSDTTNTPPITCDIVLEDFSKGLFSFTLNDVQKNFLIDTIMMTNLKRNTWTREWNLYRTNPNNTDYQAAILYRCHLLMRYLVRMAEYQMC
jgi:uncharacterized protein (DUF1800 family)